MTDTSTPDASKLLTDAAAALASGNPEQAGNLIQQAFEAEPRIKQAARKAPKTIAELMPLLRRKDAAGPVVRQLRHSLGLSQERVAEICGVTKASVAFWEIGRNAMSEDAISRLLAYTDKLGVKAIDQEGPSPQSLLKLREMLGFTQASLAMKLGVKETIIRRIEIGNMSPPISVIEGYQKLAKEHGVEFDIAA